MQLRFDALKRVNFASAQNKVPVIRSLRLANQSERAFDDLRVALESQPPVIRPKTWAVDRLAAGTDLDLFDLSTEIDVQRLAGLNETEVGILKLKVSGSEGTLLEESRTLELLARDQWGGIGDMDRLLAACVSPNDPAVASVLKEASVLLEQADHNGSMEGYQSGDPQRAWMIAGAIWSAVTGMGLTYAKGPSLATSDDPIGDLAREIGVDRVSQAAREYLAGVIKWYATVQQAGTKERR